MKKIILKLLLIVIVASLAIFGTNKVFYSNNVYVITYDTYKFNHELKGLILNTEDENFTVRANSEYQAKQKTLDMIYLNQLCIADKVVIKKIVEL